MRWQDEMRQNEQNRNATNRLKAAFRRKKEENTIGLKKIANENDQLEQQNATNNTSNFKLQTSNFKLQTSNFKILSNN